jgi:hypothetical protein
MRQIELDVADSVLESIETVAQRIAYTVENCAGLVPSGTYSPMQHGVANKYRITINVELMESFDSEGL